MDVRLFFLYKHESVIEELGEMDEDEVAVGSEEISLSGLEKELNKLFIEEKLYLNPQLKLSDVARQVGTNRTYLSRFFNQEKQMTFFDYVNNLRVEHAVGLLQKSNLRLNVIAEQSGFNSISTFRRVLPLSNNVPLLNIVNASFNRNAKSCYV